MKTPIDIERARTAERDKKIILRHETGTVGFREIAGEFGLPEAYVRELVLRYHRSRMSRNAAVYAQMVEHQGSVSWAAPAPESDSETFPMTELRQALEVARKSGQRVMIAVALLPEDNSIEYQPQYRNQGAMA